MSDVPTSIQPPDVGHTAHRFFIIQELLGTPDLARIYTNLLIDSRGDRADVRQYGRDPQLLVARIGPVLRNSSRATARGSDHASTTEFGATGRLGTRI